MLTKTMMISLALTATAVSATAATNYLREACAESSYYRGSFTKNENWAVGSRSGTQCPAGALHADDDYVLDGWHHLICRDAANSASVTFGGKSLTIADAYPKVPTATTLEFPRDGLIFGGNGGLTHDQNLTLKGKVTVKSTSGQSYFPGFRGSANKTLKVMEPISGGSTSAISVGQIYSGLRSGDNYTARFEGGLSNYTGYVDVCVNNGGNSTYAIDAPNWRAKLLVAGSEANLQRLRVRDGCYIGVANSGETLTLKGALYFNQNSGIAVDYAGTLKLDGTLSGWVTPVRILTGKTLDDGKTHSFAAVVAPSGKTFTLDEFDIPAVTFAEGTTTVEYSIKTVDERSVLWCDVKAKPKNVIRVWDSGADKGTFVKNENWKDYPTDETCAAGDLDSTAPYYIEDWGFLGATNYHGTGKISFGGKSLTIDKGSIMARGNEALEVEFPRDGLIGVCGSFCSYVAGATVTVTGSLTVGKCYNSNYPFGFMAYVENAVTRLTASLSATTDSTGLSVGLGWADRPTTKNFTMIFDGDMSAYSKQILVRYGQNTSVVTGPAWGAKALFGTSPVASTVRVSQSCYVGAAKAGTTAVITGTLNLLTGSGLAIDNEGLLRVDGTLTLPTVTKVLVGKNFNDGGAHSFAAFQAPEGVTLAVSQFQVEDTGYFSSATVSLSVKDVDGRSTLWCDVTPIQDNHIRSGCGESSIYYDTFRKNENWAVGSGKGKQCPTGALNAEQGYWVDGWEVLRVYRYNGAEKVTFGGLYMMMSGSLVDVYNNDYEVAFPGKGLIGKYGTFRYLGSAGATLTVSGAFRSELTTNRNYPFGFIGKANTKIRLTGPMTASSDSIGISVGQGWSGYVSSTNFTVSFEGDLSEFSKRILVQYANTKEPVVAPAWGVKALFGETTAPGAVYVKTNCYVGAAVDGKTATLTGAVTLNSGAGIAIDSTGTLKVDGSLSYTAPIRVNVGPSLRTKGVQKFTAFIAPKGKTLALGDFDLEAGRRGKVAFSVEQIDGRSALCCEKLGMVLIVR